MRSLATTPNPFVELYRRITAIVSLDFFEYYHLGSVWVFRPRYEGFCPSPVHCRASLSPKGGRAYGLEKAGCRIWAFKNVTRALSFNLRQTATSRGRMSALWLCGSLRILLRSVNITYSLVPKFQSLLYIVDN